MNPAKLFASWDARRLNDGYPHRRDELGHCCNCGASPQEPHYLLRKRPTREVG